MTGPSRLLGPLGLELGYRIPATSISLMGHTLCDLEIRCHVLAQRRRLRVLAGAGAPAPAGRVVRVFGGRIGCCRVGMSAGTLRLTPSKPRPRGDLDSPWKEALDLFLAPFLHLFFPAIHAAIDWERGYEILDKELLKISHDARIGRRLADRLFKVWRRNGQEAWLLIHIEVQGRKEPGFGERMSCTAIASTTGTRSRW